MGDGWLTVANSLLNLLLVGIGIYLAHNLRRQLQLKIVDRRLESYARLWGLMEVAGPWRVEAGLGPMTAQERRELFDRMTGWYFDSGNGMLLAATTRELYLNAKFNLICGDDELRPRTLVSYLQGSAQEREQERGRLSMSQLSLLRAQMRYDLAIYGALYQTGALGAKDEIFLKEAGADLRKPPWRSRTSEEKTAQRGFFGIPR